MTDDESPVLGGHTPPDFVLEPWEDEQPMTDTTAPTTFAFDHTVFMGDTDPLDIDDVITEYQRQLAEAGYVVVRREDVQFAARMLSQGDRSTSERSTQVIDRLFAALSRYHNHAAHGGETAKEG